MTVGPAQAATTSAAHQRRPTLAIYTLNSPAEAVAEEDLGALMIHLQVDGRDGVFFIDSGAANSSYGAPQMGPRRKLSLQAGGRTIAEVTPAEADGSPIYDSTVTRPAGILGRDFLSQVVLLFDRRKERVQLWPSQNFDAKQAQTGPGWITTNCHTDPWQRLNIEMSIDGKPMTGVIDTGCSDTVLEQRTFRTTTHWTYAQVKDHLWDREAAQDFALVPDVVLPFLRLPIATVGNMVGDPYAQAWIGEDFLNQGRWTMDLRHRLFGFQAYTFSPPVRLHLMGSDILMAADGSFGFAPRFRSAKVLPIERINGRKPQDVLGVAGADPRSLAYRLKMLASQPTDIEFRTQNGLTRVRITPWQPEGLASIAELAEQQSHHPPK